jgi:hypothetical protein
MGACYCLRRDWYFQIGSPLAIFEAWGGDEEILSVATWMMGGRVWLLPVTCGHIWAAPRARPEAADADRQGNRKDILPNEWLAMWANHYAMLAAIPMPESDRARFERHLDQGNHRNERIRELLAPRRPAIDHLRSVLEMAPVTWYNLIETKRIMEVKGGIMQKKKTADQTETAAIQPDSSARPDTPPRPVCRRCGGTSFSKGRTRNYHPRCLKCGWIYNG